MDDEDTHIRTTAHDCTAERCKAWNAKHGMQSMEYLFGGAISHDSKHAWNSLADSWQHTEACKQEAYQSKNSTYDQCYQNQQQHNLWCKLCIACYLWHRHVNARAANMHCAGWQSVLGSWSRCCCHTRCSASIRCHSPAQQVFKCNRIAAANPPWASVLSLPQPRYRLQRYRLLRFGLELCSDPRYSPVHSEYLPLPQLNMQAR